ncbi:MAG TPA: glycosyltransferase family 87 protein [Xanthobacteraceae bacterium]|nr:glycosyltransferase family 87 protein [Xanthobacteraceae bacterium]
MTAARSVGARALFRRYAAVLASGRVDVIARCFVAIALLVYAVDLMRQTSDGLTDGAGRPFGDDFVNYWSGAFLAWHHRAAEIYNAAAFHAFEQSVVGEHLGGFHYSYPPTLLVLTAPLALIPYVPALGLWISIGWLAFYRALRLAMPEGRTLLLALAAPAVFVNTVGGQNGTWTAALFGGGLGLLDRRPLLAGGLLGLLIYKPHLGILLPLALLAGRRWRAFAAAAATAGGLVAVSAIWLGPEILADYLRQIAWLRHVILEDGTGVWHRMLSVFVAARRLGADVPTAYVAQALVGALAGLAVAAVWLRDGPFGARNAALVLGTCLATPYLQDYDLVFGALVVAWLGQDARGGSARDYPLFFASASILLIPLFAATLANLTGLALGPLFILPAFAIALKQGLAERAECSSVKPA